MGEDIEEVQEFPMDAAGCRHDCREECSVDIRSRIILTILLHFGAGIVIQQQVWITVMRSKRRKLDGEVREGLLLLQLCLQHLELSARLRQAGLEEMLKEEEGRC